MGFLGGLFDGLFGGQKPVQTSHMRQQTRADRKALEAQIDISKLIGEGLRDLGYAGGDVFGQQLDRRGALASGFQADLDRGAASRALKDPTATALSGGAVSASAANRRTRDRGRRMAAAQNRTQREDLANIFGQQLAQRANLASLTSGQLKEAAPKRSGFDKFLDGVNNVIGGIFG